MPVNYTSLTRKQKKLDGFRPLPGELVRNLGEWLRVELTYTSNAIEGNTLTRRETAEVVEKGLTVGGKTLREHLEATNHVQALEVVYALAGKTAAELTATDVRGIHRLILNGIDDANAGRYREVAVRISGSAAPLPDPVEVPALMNDFFRWLTDPASLAVAGHPVAFAGEAHYRLVTIHPFVDGNGRAARLLMNLLLLMLGYMPAIIYPRDRLAYLGALEQAQLGGSREQFDQLIADAAEHTLDLYLRAIRGQASAVTPSALHQGKLLKIGELAKLVDAPVPTIRFWTKEGLLEVAEVTPSGYQLFDPSMQARCAEIRKLQAQRFTIAEIKQRL